MFFVLKNRPFSTVSTRFSTSFAENLQKKRGKVLFRQKNYVENTGKTVEYPFLWGKIVEIPRPPQRSAAHDPPKKESFV